MLDAVREGFGVTVDAAGSADRREPATRSARSRRCARAGATVSEPARAGIRVDVPLVPPGGRRLRGARALERDGVLAAVVPAAPERAVVNAVVYRSADGLEAAYDEVASVDDEIGAKWTVWVPPGDDAAAAGLLESHGGRAHAPTVGDGAPPLDGVELAARGGARATGPPRASLTDVSEINDRSYTFGTDSFSRALKRLPDGAAHVYVVSDGGAPVGCLLVLDHEGNSEIQVVAVVPEARGRGITTKLLGPALADAAERGNRDRHADRHPAWPTRSTSAHGFEPLERVSMWERETRPRPAAAASPRSSPGRSRRRSRAAARASPRRSTNSAIVRLPSPRAMSTIDLHDQLVGDGSVAGRG